MVNCLILLSVALPAALVLWYLKFWWSHRRILSTASRLPCPPTIPLLGNALFFTGGVTNITHNIIRFTTQFKGLFCMWVGPVPVFVVSDPTDVQTVLNSSNTLEKDDIYKFLKPFLGNGLLTAPVPMWKKYRRLITPVFQPANVEQFVPEFNDISRTLSNELGCGRSIDPRERLFNASVDAIMSTMIPRGALDSTTKQNIQLLFDKVGRLFTYRLFKVWLQIDWLFNILYRSELKLVFESIAACLKVFDQQWNDETIKRTSLDASKLADKLDCEVKQSILDVAWKYPSELSEEHKWSDEIFTIIVGATDTVVAALSYLMVSLANHPETQEKIRQEIKDVMGDSSRDVSVKDLEAMQYLDCALLEAMRLHGVFPAIFRKVTKDTVLNKSSTKTILPAGSRICIALHAMGLNPDRFPEPKKFLPERFLDTTEADRNSSTFLPFSRGPRGCPGKGYSMLFMKTIMVHLLRKYHLTSTVKLEDIEYELKVVMFSKTSLPIMFVPLLNK